MPLYRAELQRRRGLLPPVLIHDPSQVLYLPFDKDDGSYARDRSGYVNHGTIIGATRVAGKIGGALSFDGVNDYVQSPYSAILNPPKLTAMFWIKLLTLPADHGTLYLRCLHEIYYNVGGFEVYFVKATSKLLFNVAHKEGTTGLSSTKTNWAVGVWYHIAVTNDGAIYNMYVDGVLHTNRAGPAMGNGEKPFRVSDIAYPINAVIDEVRIYNRALSAAEIARLMNMRGL